MRLLAIILFVLLLAGCADNNSTTKGIQAFDAEDYAIAHEELTPLAARGNPEAQFYIAKMHYFGFGVPKDLDIAFVRYADSAEQGYAKAQHNLGLMFIYGDSVEEDADTGYAWISKSAEQGFALSQFWMGVALTLPDSPLQQDIARGLDYYRAAAAQDFPQAITQVGSHFADVDLDYKKAGEYFEKAAALGDAEAMYRLSFAYANGIERKQDQEKAFELLKGAAEKNLPDSYLYLAMRYQNGNGVEKDLGKAVSWLESAASEANNPRAMDILATFYLDQKNDFGDTSTGIKWRLKAAKMGDAQAQYNLWVDYNLGWNFPENKTTAIMWLKNSADQKFPIAQLWLGRRYLTGTDVPKNPTKGASLIKDAAQTGHEESIKTLGSLYLSGMGVTQNYSEAVGWLEKVATQNSDAAHLLGSAYLYGGHGLVKDHEKALVWLKNVSDLNNYDAKLLIASCYVLICVDSIDLGKAQEILAVVLADTKVKRYLSEANYLMGVIRLKTTNDLAGAFPWFLKAAEAGDVESQYFVGMALISEVSSTFISTSYGGIQWLAKAAHNGHADAQYMLGLLYLVGGERLGLNLVIEEDLNEAKRWLSLATSQGNIEAEETLVGLNKELQSRKDKIAEQKEIERLERLAKLEKVERKKQAAEQHLAEYRRQQAYQARQPKRPSLVESFIGGFFKALGEGVAMGVNAKINKELGIKNYDPYSSRLRDLEKIGEEARIQARREARKIVRMEKIQKNLRTPPKIGCESYGC